MKIDTGRRVCFGATRPVFLHRTRRGRKAKLKIHLGPFQKKGSRSRGFRAGNVHRKLGRSLCSWIRLPLSAVTAGRFRPHPRDGNTVHFSNSCPADTRGLIAASSAKRTDSTLRQSGIKKLIPIWRMFFFPDFGRRHTQRRWPESKVNPTPCFSSVGAYPIGRGRAKQLGAIRHAALPSIASPRRRVKPC